MNLGYFTISFTLFSYNQLDSFSYIFAKIKSSCKQSHFVITESSS